MPRIEVVFYRDEDGTVPVLDWLDEVRRRDKRAFAKCYVRIQLLQFEGHELRRPYCDYLRDGIYELRIRFGAVNYRILYFFSGQIAAILAHGLEKESKVSDRDIELAIARKERFEKDPGRHSYEEE